MKRLLFCLFLACISEISPAVAADWPQLQGNAARTGSTTDSVAPPYKFKWAWMGPGNTQTALPLAGGASVTIAGRVQAVVSGGSVFVGSMDGGAYAINATTGATTWSASLPGGTVASAAVAAGVVVFVTTKGVVYGFNVTNGAQLWSYDSGFAMTTAPCIQGSVVYTANHHGDVVALTVASGTLVWSARVTAPVAGEIAADATSVYVPSEDMYVSALSATTGSVTASHRVWGQSFQNTNPVVFNGKLWVTSACGPGKCSLGAFESILGSVTSLAQEKTVIQAYLNGDTVNGGVDASIDWRHYFALNLPGLSEPFLILAAPSEGTGHPPDSMVVDNTSRVLAYFKTKFPTLTAADGTLFGTAYSQDIAGVDQTTGDRIQINNGKLAQPWPWETDNLFHMSVGGTYLWLHQRFRGTQVINLATSTRTLVQANMAVEDGGNFAGAGYSVIYLNGTDVPRPSTPQPYTDGWMSVSISGTQAYIAEPFAIVAVGP
jgi:outer membrane protein assembly factor BamB